MKSLALTVLGILVLGAWFFEIELLRTLLIFGFIGVLVIWYEQIFDMIFSSDPSKSESSKKSKDRGVANSGSNVKSEMYWQGAAIQNCASCKYWSGERKLDSSRIGLYFNQFELAQCAGGGRDRVKVSAVQMCQKYAKLPNLKQ